MVDLVLGRGQLRHDLKHVDYGELTTYVRVWTRHCRLTENGELKVVTVSIVV